MTTNVPISLSTDHLPLRDIIALTTPTDFFTIKGSFDEAISSFCQILDEEVPDNFSMMDFLNLAIRVQAKMRYVYADAMLEARVAPTKPIA